MTRPVRVLQVLGGLGMGGAETWLMAVLRRWARDGSGQMDFLLTGGERAVFDDEAAGLGAGLHYLRYGRAHLASFVGRYRRLLAQGRYDAIHDHSDYAAGWRFLLGGSVLPQVRVAHVHNPWLHIQANYAISPGRRMAAAGGKALVGALASHVCGTSGEILRQYGFEPGLDARPKVEVLHCGFDVGRFNASREPDRARVLAEFGWPADTKLVLFAGRIDRALEFVHPQNHKNSWLALNIAREAAARDPAVRLIMAGNGPSRDALIKAVAGWDLSDQLRLPGIRSDIPVLMRAADILLFPSAQEGLGMVAVEAQAAGLPVLASETVPREAVVIPELYNSLPLDAPLQTWADRLVAIMDLRRPDPAVSRAALEASDFSIANSASKLEAIYRSGA
jgi:glycosyltransferase EpsF